jgi:alkanesulfonate monooxygenase SsuD/methylene tetrahydromethanopterin reductase-like flavin-dependent oxidoreductase (luciferase family)
VAKYADWWFLDYDKTAADLAGVEDSLRRAIDGMTRRAAKYGRKVRFAFNPFVAFGPTDEAALERAKKLLTPEEPDADVRKMMSRVGPAMKSGCIGKPQRVRDQLLCYRDMGIELFLLKFVPTVDEVHAIRDEIIAPLRQNEAAAQKVSATAVG